MTSLFPRRELVRTALLAMAAVVVWVFVQGGKIDWHSPPSYSVDSLETLARFQLAAERGSAMILQPGAPRLGAPWGADWAGYPLPDALWYWVLGKLVGMFGLIPTCYLALAFAHVAATVAFYLSARVLRHRVPLAAAGALVFGFCFSIFERGLSHHSFALVYPVPLALLCLFLIGGSRHALERRPWQIFCVVAAALVGAGNPYLIFLFLQLLGFALLYQWCTTRRRANLRVGGAVAGVVVLVFVATNFPTLAHTLRHGGEHLTRNYSASELYGLKPIELVVPPPAHRWTPAAELGRLYASSTQLRGELFTSYAGFVGTAAVIATCTLGLLALWRSRRPLRPAHLPLLLWIVLFAMVGGINGLLALSGFDLFRAGNRYSIHLLALALLFLTGWVSRRARKWPELVVWACALPVAALALWDQLPRAPDARGRLNLKTLAQADARAAAALERALPPGAAIFQLPVVPFPEAGPRHQLNDYEHLRLHLHSTHLRFSYGAMRASAAYRWNEWVAALPPSHLVTTLAEAGFAGILLDRRGYEDEGRDLLANFARTGREVSAVEGAPHLMLVRLPPVPQPALPDLTNPRLAEPWSGDHTPLADLSVHALAGWSPEERRQAIGWRWAGKSAAIVIWNGGAQPRPVMIRGLVRSASPGRLAVKAGERTLWSGPINGTPIPVEFALDLDRGGLQLDWIFDGRIARPPGEARRLGFMLENFTVETRH